MSTELTEVTKAVAEFDRVGAGLADHAEHPLSERRTVQLEFPFMKDKKQTVKKPKETKRGKKSK